MSAISFERTLEKETSQIRLEIAELRTDIQTAIADLRSEMKADFSDMQKQISARHLSTDKVDSRRIGGGGYALSYSHEAGQSSVSLNGRRGIRRRHTIAFVYFTRHYATPFALRS